MLSLPHCKLEGGRGGEGRGGEGGERREGREGEGEREGREGLSRVMDYSALKRRPRFLRLCNFRIRTCTRNFVIDLCDAEVYHFAWCTTSSTVFVR